MCFVGTVGLWDKEGQTLSSHKLGHQDLWQESLPAGQFHWPSLF